ncbi:MAG TPA: protease HtpX [bacterium]|nr:protease HtpX [bacterium]
MWLRRISLFILVNFLVMMTIGIVMRLLGLDNFFAERGIDYGSLMVFCLVWGFGGAFISLMVSRWAAKTFNGVQVINPENPGSQDERWLLETVHRLARTAGLETMPEVGFYNSPDPNAFATGPGRDSALVAVSSGLFQMMDKDEIEGVLGHELTHVVNGDMVTMALLQGVINSFVIFLSYAVTMAISRGNNNRREGFSIGDYFIRMALQMLFGILGMIPLMAFSRWREFRADAGSARLSGKTKMINALRALQRAYERPAQVAPEPATVAAFKISSRDGFSLFASHPPLEKRIERLQSASLVASED